MGYPQPNASAYQAAGAKFFRLNTRLTSEGDIYESAVGALGFAIGPDSDVAKINIGYFDDQSRTKMSQVAITPQRPFLGRIDAQNGAQYAPAQRPGRIMMWPDAFYNPRYQVYLFGNPCRMDMIAPVIDVIQYLSPPPSVSPGRNDRRHFLPEIGLPAGFSNTAPYLLGIPFYGRRYASISGGNFSSGALKLSVLGANFGSAFTTTLYPRTAFGINDQVVIKSGTSGMFDYLFLEVTKDVGSPALTSNLITFSIVTSDKE